MKTNGPKTPNAGETPAIKTTRRRVYSLSYYALLDMFTDGTEALVLSGIPAGARQVGFELDIRAQNLYMVAEHDSFEETVQGKPLPRGDLQIRRQPRTRAELDRRRDHLHAFISDSDDPDKTRARILAAIQNLGKVTLEERTGELLPYWMAILTSRDVCELALIELWLVDLGERWVTGASE